MIGMVLSADPEQRSLHAGHRGRGRGARHFRYSVPSCAGRRARRAWWMASWWRIPPTKRRRNRSSTSLLPAPTKASSWWKPGANRLRRRSAGAIEFGHDCCKKIAAGIRELAKQAGKPKRSYTPPTVEQGPVRTRSRPRFRAELTRRAEHGEVRQAGKLRRDVASARRRRWHVSRKSSRPKRTEALRRPARSAFSATKC